PTQSRFLSRLHHRAQLQALPHTRIPAHSAVLVLHTSRPDLFSSLERRASMGGDSWMSKILGAPDNIAVHGVPALLGDVLSDFLFDFSVQIARICTPVIPCDLLATGPCRLRRVQTKGYWCCSGRLRPFAFGRAASASDGPSSYLSGPSAY